MNFFQLLQETVHTLEQADIDDAQAEAFQIIEFCFGMSRSQLFLQQKQLVPDEGYFIYQDVIKRRTAREPLQYITGIREFWSLDFHVSPAVLIPRPETEFLLDRVLSVCRQYEITPRAILDMCTGSGVIAVILAQELSAASIVAVDKSEQALQIASRNLDNHNVADRVQLVCSDLFSVFSKNRQFDLIVSNPPYVATHYLETMQPEVKFWEPHSALFAGAKGLDIIIKLADSGHKHLNSGGWMFIEIGDDQSEDVEQLFMSHKSRAYEKVEVLPDWSGRPRVLQARKVQRNL